MKCSFIERLYMALVPGRWQIGADKPSHRDRMVKGTTMIRYLQFIMEI